MRPHFGNIKWLLEKKKYILSLHINRYFPKKSVCVECPLIRETCTETCIPSALIIVIRLMRQENWSEVSETASFMRSMNLNHICFLRNIHSAPHSLFPPAPPLCWHLWRNFLCSRQSFYLLPHLSSGVWNCSQLHHRISLLPPLAVAALTMQVQVDPWPVMLMASEVARKRQRNCVTTWLWLVARDLLQSV